MISSSFHYRPDCNKCCVPSNQQAAVGRASFCHSFAGNLSACCTRFPIASYPNTNLTRSSHRSRCRVKEKSVSPRTHTCSKLWLTNSIPRSIHSAVLMQYYGYLQRNPDDPPDNDFRVWEFWLNKLNQFNGNFVQAEMVKAFIVSLEYRRRFEP